jgi:rhamnose transport system substrate-binding protein
MPGSGGLSFVFIPKNTGNPYFASIDTGLQKGCAEIGATYKTGNGPDSADAAKQIKVINDQVQTGVNVLVLAPDSADELNNTLDAARAKGVKVITADADLVGNETHRDAFLMSSDFDQVGPSQIELLGGMINYTGDFAILSATTDATNQNYWIAGMKKTLADPKYSKMNLVTIVYGNDDPQKSRTEADGLLSRYPNLRGILCPTSVGVEQAAKAVQDKGVYPGGPNAKDGGVVVTGLGTPNQMKGYIKQGVISAVALWDPANMGYIAAYLGKGLIDGSIVSGEGKTFTVPNKGTFTFLKDNKVVAGPPLVFTKDNIDQYNF